MNQGTMTNDQKNFKDCFPVSAVPRLSWLYLGLNDELLMRHDYAAGDVNDFLAAARVRGRWGVLPGLFRDGFLGLFIGHVSPRLG